LEREAEGGSGWGLVLIKRRYKKNDAGDGEVAMGYGRGLERRTLSGRMPLLL
jgi:hypothetical protein